MAKPDMLTGAPALQADIERANRLFPQKEIQNRVLKVLGSLDGPSEGMFIENRQNGLFNVKVMKIGSMNKGFVLIGSINDINLARYATDNIEFGTESWELKGSVPNKMKSREISRDDVTVRVEKDAIGNLKTSICAFFGEEKRPCWYDISTFVESCQDGTLPCKYNDLELISQAFNLSTSTSIDAPKIDLKATS